MNRDRSFQLPRSDTKVSQSSARTVNAIVQLSMVADPTDVDHSHAPLMTSAQGLTGDWICYKFRNPAASVPVRLGAVSTQQLGAALYVSGCLNYL